MFLLMNQFMNDSLEYVNSIQCLFLLTCQSMAKLNVLSQKVTQKMKIILQARHFSVMFFLRVLISLFTLCLLMNIHIHCNPP